MGGGGGGGPGIKKVDWDAFDRQLNEQLYLNLLGPTVIASAIGMAASPSDCGGGSGLSTGMAWRGCWWRGAKRAPTVAKRAQVHGRASRPRRVGWRASP